MADIGGPGAGQNRTESDERFKFERRAALFAGIVVVGFVLYLVQRNSPFSDPNLVIMMRIVLSLAVGIIGATIPGFLQVEYNGAGFGIRAAGALALFVITYFGTPQVASLNLSLPEPKVSVLMPRVVDFRTQAMPTQKETDRANAPTVVTIPTEIRSIAEPARKATLSTSRVSFALGGNSYDFNWRYFVNMHPERFGVWLGIDEDAHSSQIEAGGTLFREIMYESGTPIRWEDFVRHLLDDDSNMLTVSQTLVIEDASREARCAVNLAKWRTEVKRFMDNHKVLPGRITMDCEAQHA